MSRITFITLLLLSAIVRGPISLLLIVLKNLSKPLKQRIDFERKNLNDELSRSFLNDQIQADYCFEVSSEGELEQVRPLIESFLQLNKRIEIIFSSPSVEAKCIKLSLDSRGLIRILRLPIASFFPFTFLFFQSPWSWVTAPKILFCRYDFFPELLSFKFFGKKLILLSASAKKPSWFKSQANSLFNLIIAANDKEALHFRNSFVNTKVLAFDFRVPRIFQRIDNASIVLSSHKELSDYLNFLNTVSSTNKIILGSAWESDLVILKSDIVDNTLEIDVRSGNLHLLIVPHKLKKESIDKLTQSLARLFPNLPVYEISNEKKFQLELFKAYPGIVIFNFSGVLCELYTKFSLAYVGGGFESSIHSVLEPFLSGCRVACGPKIQRSTEYDLIKGIVPGEIQLLKNPESFYSIMKQYSSETPEFIIRQKLGRDSHLLMESIINEIETC